VTERPTLGRVFNLLELDLHELEEAPPGHTFSARSPGDELGASRTGFGVYELQPGSTSWPYHFELVEEEWLVVFSGEVTLRTPEGERVLRAGDVACFPPGPVGAHAVRNHGDVVARYGMPSSVEPYGGGAVYPDSGKVHVVAPGFRHRGRLGETVEYWEGEE
jgi:uncharacterized cupin superfamily protein